MTPEQADWLYRAGTGVMLVLLVGLILVTGAREVWVWGSTLQRALKREEQLRAENAALRTSLDANTAAGKASSEAFVKSLEHLADVFEREFERLTDELRRGPVSVQPPVRSRARGRTT